MKKTLPKKPTNNLVWFSVSFSLLMIVILAPIFGYGGPFYSDGWPSGFWIFGLFLSSILSIVFGYELFIKKQLRSY